MPRVAPTKGAGEGPPPKSPRPFEELTRLADAVTGTRERAAAKAARAAFVAFLKGLSDRETARIVRGWRKLPRARQDELFRAFNLVGGSYGPADPLMRVLYEDEAAWPEDLPEPEPPGGTMTAEDWRHMHAEILTLRLVHEGGWPADMAGEIVADATRLDGPQHSAEEWAASLAARGLRGDVAAAVAEVLRRGGDIASTAKAEAARTTDDLMRDFCAENGAPPEMLEEMVTYHRRSRKWAAATNATLAAEGRRDVRAFEDALRAACPKIERHAEAMVKELGGLAADPTADRAAAVRDDAGARLFSAVNAALIRWPAPGVEEWSASTAVWQWGVQRKHPDVPGDPWAWHEVTCRALELADEIEEGGPADVANILEVAQALKTVANQAQAWTQALGRTEGRPSKDALDAAAALRSQKLTWTQIAAVLDRRGLHLDPHTPDNIRKSVQARARKSGDKYPR